MNMMHGVVYFLGLHSRQVERPLQGGWSSGLKGRLYKPRSTAWVMNQWLWPWVFIHTVYDGHIYFPRVAT
jgi:hypothetical protein